MKRVTTNALVDIGCLITFIPSLISGLVLFFVLPSGSGRGGGFATYLSIARDNWLNMHNYWSLAFAALLIIHLMLHWKFFRHIKKALGTNATEPGDTME